MEAECEDSNGLGEINIGDTITTEMNDKLVQKSEENQIPACIDDDNKKETDDVEKTHIEPAGCLQSECYKIESVPEVSRSTEQVYENGKRKIKEEKPPTKIVMRRLPPLMTKEIFLEQVSPLPPYDYMYFVTGDPSYGIYSFSRAYLNFINQEDVFTFTRTFDNYVFIDAKGQEYPAVVEFSPFQRVPKQRSKKKDTLTGTIESDPLYISFKENLLAEALENSKPGAKTMKQHYFETEISTTEEINTTPLLEFLKQRRAEKARIRDERREEKKRKEAERKLKQKAKEKKIDGDEEETKDVKIHHCTVSAEKTFNKGEFTLLLKSEREKVTEKIITSDERESNSASKGIFSKESHINSDKIIIKKRKERNMDNVNFPPELIENNNNNNISIAYRKPFNKESNTEHHNNRQSLVPSKTYDYDEYTFSSKESMSNNSQIRVVTNVCGLKKAEKQTQYLRKILGLSSQDNSSPSDMVTVKSTSLDKGCPTLDNITDTLGNLTCDAGGKQRHEPKIYVSSQRTLWCDRNINPALPSASFKTSTTLMACKNEKDIKTICNPNLHDECKIKINKKEDSSMESSQVLQSKDRRERDGKDKDNKAVKKKEEKDKQLKENRTREFKNRSGKSYQEERIRQAERREERKKESSSISSDRKSEAQSHGGKEHDERTETIDMPPVQEEKSRSFIEKKRTYENKKKTDLDDWKGGDDGDKRTKTDRNRGERRQRERERKRREEFASRKGFDKKCSDIEKKKSKSYKCSSNEYCVDVKENLIEIEKNVQKTDSIEPKAEVPTDQCDSRETVNGKAQENISEINEVITGDENNSAVTHRRKSLESGEIVPDRRENDGFEFTSKRRNSLESVNAAKNKFMLESSNKSEIKHLEEAPTKSEHYGNSKMLHDDFSKTFKIKSNPDKVKGDHIKSLGQSEQCEHAKDSAKNDNGNKSNDIKTKNSESSNNADSSSRSKDPRSDRRIRNKDRPSLQIYRPGMGKFSKQRLEKEKVLGSSTEVDSPSHSPSPSPKVKFPS